MDKGCVILSIERVYNFSAGPSTLPLAVLEKAASELVNFGDSGMSVMEMSHRSPVYEGIIANVEANIRKLMNIPDNYKVLFMQGGATAQVVCLMVWFLSTALIIPNRSAQAQVRLL